MEEQCVDELKSIIEKYKSSISTKYYINTTFDQTKKNRQIKKFQLIIPMIQKLETLYQRN